MSSDTEIDEDPEDQGLVGFTHAQDMMLWKLSNALAMQADRPDNSL